MIFYDCINLKYKRINNKSRTFNIKTYSKFISDINYGYLNKNNL